MSPQVKDQARYHDIIVEAIQGGWADPDTIYKRCADEGIIDGDFIERAVAIAFKDKIRNDLKKGTFVDEDGRVIKVASILAKDSKGAVRRVYKDEMLFDIGDCIQVVRYWRGRRKYCGKKVKYYTKLTITLHGPQAQSILPLRD